jgi:hypothetical protein
MCTLARNTEFSCHVSDRPGVTDYPINQQLPTMKSQTSISVRHEDLRVSRDVRHLH